MMCDKGLSIWPSLSSMMCASEDKNGMAVCIITHSGIPSNTQSIKSKRVVISKHSPYTTVKASNKISVLLSGLDKCLLYISNRKKCKKVITYALIRECLLSRGNRLEGDVGSHLGSHVRSYVLLRKRCPLGRTLGGDDITPVNPDRYHWEFTLCDFDFRQSAVPRSFSFCQTFAGVF